MINKRKLPLSVSIILCSLLIFVVLYSLYSIFEKTTSKIIIDEKKQTYTEERIFPKKENMMRVADFDKEIYHEKSGKYILKKDLLIDYGILLEKNIVIDANGHDIFVENCVAGFFIKSNVTIKNANIFVTDTSIFANIDDKAKLILEKNKIILQENSSFYITGNYLELKNNIVENHSAIQKEDSRLLEFVGEEFEVETNTFIDTKNVLKYGVLLNRVQKGLFIGNTVVSYLSGLQAPLLIDNSSNILIDENIIFDRNTLDRSIMEKSEKKGEDGIILDGTISLGIYSSNKIYTKNGNFLIGSNMLRQISSQLIDVEKNKFKGSLAEKDYSLEKINNCLDLRQMMKIEFNIENEIFCL